MMAAGAGEARKLTTRPRCAVGSFRAETQCPHAATHFAALMPVRSDRKEHPSHEHPGWWYFDTGWRSLRVMCSACQEAWRPDGIFTVDWRPIAELGAYLDDHALGHVPEGRDWSHDLQVLALHPDQVAVVVRAVEPEEVTCYLRAIGGSVVEHVAGMWQGQRYSVTASGRTKRIR